MSAAVDAGIREAYGHDAITSTSLLACGPTAREAGAWAGSQPGLSVGLHLGFVQGRALSAPGRIPSLLDREGALPASVLHLALRRPSARDLLREAEAQLGVFLLAVGRAPDFVNTHQHAQLLPGVLRAVLTLCARHGVRRIRLPAEHHPLRPRAGRPRSWLWPAATALALTSRRALARAGLRHPDRMLGGPESGRLTASDLTGLIAGLRGGTTELVAHPALGSTDLSALTAPTTARALGAAGVERIGFRVL